MKYRNYSSIEEFFDLLNCSRVRYVVLRNYENMHNADFFVDGHEDIDLLVEDIDRFIEVTNAIPKMWPEDKTHLVVYINKIGVPLDVRCIGDCYYDPKWEYDIITRRKLAENGNWYVMSADDYYYSLIYHSILQKLHISQDYIERLDTMAQNIGVAAVGIKQHLASLSLFLRKMSYECTKPNDLSVPLFTERMYKKFCFRNIFKKIVAKIKVFFKYVLKLLYKETFLKKLCWDKKKGHLKDIDFIARKVKLIFGEDIYDQLAERKIYRYLDKYEKEIDDMFSYQKQAILEKPNANIENCVFTMWWQGVDNMPDVVKSCVVSLHKIGKQVIVLTHSNIRDYVNLPDYIWNKFTAGKISMAHFSDIVRIYCLAVYGGLWADATVYIANSVPSYMTEKFFVFKQSPQLREVRSYRNWWIAAPSGYNLIVKQLAALLVYWKNEDVAYHYYIFHILWKKFVETHLDFIEVLDRITDSTHLLLRRYDCVFDEIEWDEMKKISPVFKCTYKMKGISHLDSYYMKLCNNALP